MLKEDGVKMNFEKRLTELSKRYFKNYYQIRDLLVGKLENEGVDYFRGKDYVGILRNFPETLSTYCEIIGTDFDEIEMRNLSSLLFSYFHLGDRENYLKVLNKLKENEWQLYYCFEAIENYEPASEKNQGKLISIKYDKNIEKEVKKNSRNSSSS